MIPVSQLKNWLLTLDPDDSVYIDEGGLTLCSQIEEEIRGDAYLEIGGGPLDAIELEEDSPPPDTTNKLQEKPLPYYL